jgi:hypothetical protein
MMSITLQNVGLLRTLKFLAFTITIVSAFSQSFRLELLKNTWTSHEAWKVFIFLFPFRYIRVIVNTTSFLVARPKQIATHPTIRPYDITVIIPTVRATSLDFKECVLSILASRVASIIIATVGEERKALAIFSANSISANRIIVI